MTARRDAFLRAVLSHEGAPYLWGAKGTLQTDPRGRQVRCFDCSGLVTHCLREVGGPDWRWHHNADRLFRELPAVEHPEPGDLVFYGKPTRSSHVMIVTSLDTCFGASGGNHTTLTLDLARAQGARVKHQPRIHYRPDLLGFRRLPID